MNYIQTTFFIILFAITNCNSMEHDLDFTTVHQDNGSGRAQREAAAVLKHGTNSTELVKSLSTELKKATTLMKAHPEARIEFNSFVITFANILQQNNLTISTQVFNEEITNQVPNGEDMQTQKSREELIKFLTANLTKEKILT